MWRLPSECLYLCIKGSYIFTEQEEITSAAKIHSKRQYVVQKRLQTAVLQFKSRFPPKILPAIQKIILFADILCSCHMDGDIKFIKASLKLYLFACYSILKGQQK